MKHSMWLVALAALMLAAGGCERQKTPQVTPQQKAAVEEPKAMTPEPKPALPVPDGKSEKPAAEPAVPPVTSEAAKPAAAELQMDKPAAVEPKAVAPPAKPAAAGPAAPKIVVYKASNGQVTFNHQVHANSLICSSCHTTDPPVKIALDKDKAHQMCKGCHQERSAGPTQCNGCHKKG